MGEFLLDVRAVVVRTQPNRERVADAFLRSWGFETYLPLMRVGMIKSRKRIEVDRPFLPMYLFVRDDGRSSKIKNAPGVSGFMKFGLDMASPPWSTFDDIRSRETVVGLDLLGNPVRRIVPMKEEGAVFSKGDQIEVSDESSPFYGLKGLFQCRMDEDRVVAFIKIMGRLTKTVISGSCLRKCG